MYSITVRSISTLVHHHLSLYSTVYQWICNPLKTVAICPPKDYCVDKFSNMWNFVKICYKYIPFACLFLMLLLGPTSGFPLSMFPFQPIVEGLGLLQSRCGKKMGEAGSVNTLFKCIVEKTVGVRRMVEHTFKDSKVEMPGDGKARYWVLSLVNSETFRIFPHITC